MNTTSTLTAPINSSVISNISAKVTLQVDASESLMQVSWTSAPTLSELAETAEYLATIIKQKGITQLLHDVRRVDYVNIDIQRCLTHIFCPQVVAAGANKIVHLANYILPDLLLIDQITDCVKRRYVSNRHIKFEICTTPEGAAEWFKNNSFVQSETKPKPVELKAEAPTRVLVNEVSPVITLAKTYKEKISLIAKILFKPRALFSDL